MKEWIRDIAIAVVVALLIMNFIKPTIVKEHSMEPTLYENNYIFLSKQQYRFGDVHRGDIVVFHTPLETESGAEKLLIKRVIALPGDTIEIKDGFVYLNGEALDEPYTLDGFTSGAMEPMTIGDGMMFVMGDNRQSSMDSRDSRLGPIAEDAIVGKAVFRLFPIGEIGIIK